MKKQLPRGISIIKDRTSWVLRLGKKVTGSKERRTYYKTKAEAEKEANDFLKSVSTEKQEAKALGLTALQVAEAKLAFSRLGTASLLEAIDFYLARRVEVGISLADACERTIEIKRLEGNKPRHIKDLKDHFSHIVKAAGVNALEDLDRNVILKVIKSKDGHGNDPSPSRQTKRRRYIRILISTAIEEKWLKADPSRGVRTPPVVAETVAVLTPKEIEDLLFECYSNHKAMLAPFVIKVFGGLRNSELAELKWGDIVDKTIIVRAGHAKTKRRRAVSMHKTLEHWLSICESGEKDDYVYTATRDAEDRTRAWFGVVKDIAKGAKVVIPQNALRHSFGSYHYSVGKNENQTAFEMGNSPAIVKRHYASAVTEKAAKAFWNLGAWKMDIRENAPIPESTPSSTE